MLSKLEPLDVAFLRLFPEAVKYIVNGNEYLARDRAKALEVTRHVREPVEIIELKG